MRIKETHIHKQFDYHCTSWLNASLVMSSLATDNASLSSMSLRVVSALLAISSFTISLWPHDEARVIGKCKWHTAHIHTHTHMHAFWLPLSDHAYPVTSTGAHVHYSGNVSQCWQILLVTHRRLCHVLQVRVWAPKVSPGFSPTKQDIDSWHLLPQISIDVTTGMTASLVDIRPLGPHSKTCLYLFKDFRLGS